MFKLLLTASILLFVGCAEKVDPAPPAPQEWMKTGPCAYSSALYCWGCVHIYMEREFVLRCEN